MFKHNVNRFSLSEAKWRQLINNNFQLFFICIAMLLSAVNVHADARSDIDAKHKALGGDKGLLGKATTGLRSISGGKFIHYEKGSIYWTSSNGAHEVHGAIKEKWKKLGWERSTLGYPITDEKKGADGKGRFNDFEGGSIYWHPNANGAHVINGSIKAKWKSLGAEESQLGYPITDETKTPDGRGRFNHFTGWINPFTGTPGGVQGSIYWTAATGAHWLTGPVRDRWAADRWEKGPLGYPTSDMFTSTNGYSATNFEKGQIIYKQGQGLSVLTQNMAFLVAPATYQGSNLSRAFWALIENIRELQPDVVALQEMFRDERRTQLSRELRDIYPYALHGPDEAGVESDGGLMILSRYPIVESDQIIFRNCGGEDCFAEKGVLFARIKGPFNDYHFFNTHTQNPDPDFSTSQRNTVNNQINAIHSFVEAKRGIKQLPAILVGDLNTNGLNQSHYNDMMRRLGNPIDAWKKMHPSKKGITSDRVSNFLGGASKPSASERGKNGERLDYVFYYPGTRYQPILTQTEVMMWETDAGKDMSDHYGVYSWFGRAEENDVLYRGNISKVQVKFAGFHCLEVTDGTVQLSDPDEVEWTMGVGTDGGAHEIVKTHRFNDIDTGEIFSASGYEINTPRVNDNIVISVEGKEIDDACVFGACTVTGRVSLQARKITIPKPLLYEALVRPQRYALNMMRGDGGEYVVYIDVKAFK